jgi:hypothetical protein
MLRSRTCLGAWGLSPASAGLVFSLAAGVVSESVKRYMGLLQKNCLKLAVEAAWS